MNIQKKPKTSVIIKKYKTLTMTIRKGRATDMKEFLVLILQESGEFASVGTWRSKVPQLRGQNSKTLRRENRGDLGPDG